jgi:YVTN family beta-propeller protein
VYVVNTGSATVSVINTGNNSVAATIITGTTATGSMVEGFGNFISTYPVVTGLVSPDKMSPDIAVYPNPAENDITVESTQKSMLEILNIQGQTVLQQQIQQGKTDVDISGLAKGVCILKLSSNDKTEMIKIVKE